MSGETLTVRDEFVAAIRNNQQAFVLELEDATIERLADYFEFVQKHNPILHLVGPSTPDEFATRHILESLTLLEFLPPNAHFADIGPGAGLPSIPCLIVRNDLSAVLIESKERKAGFLKAVTDKCELTARTEIINRQFSEIKRPDVGFVTCRALDRFMTNLPRLVKWSGRATLLFFGGPALTEELEKRKVRYDVRLMPLSTQRYLFRFSQ